jgi:hypothetical protein
MRCYRFSSHHHKHRSRIAISFSTTIRTVVIHNLFQCVRVRGDFFPLRRLHYSSVYSLHCLKLDLHSTSAVFILIHAQQSVLQHANLWYQLFSICSTVEYSRPAYFLTTVHIYVYSSSIHVCQLPFAAQTRNQLQCQQPWKLYNYKFSLIWISKSWVALIKNTNNIILKFYIFSNRFQ